MAPPDYAEEFRKLQFSMVKEIDYKYTNPAIKKLFTFVKSFKFPIRLLLFNCTFQPSKYKDGY